MRNKAGIGEHKRGDRPPFVPRYVNGSVSSWNMPTPDGVKYYGDTTHLILPRRGPLQSGPLAPGGGLWARASTGPPSVGHGPPGPVGGLWPGRSAGSQEIQGNTVGSWGQSEWGAPFDPAASMRSSEDENITHLRLGDLTWVADTKGVRQLVFTP